MRNKQQHPQYKPFFLLTNKKRDNKEKFSICNITHGSGDKSKERDPLKAMTRRVKEKGRIVVDSSSLPTQNAQNL